jgi:hypothetical protein
MRKVTENGRNATVRGRRTCHRASDTRSRSPSATLLARKACLGLALAAAFTACKPRSDGGATTQSTTPELQLWKIPPAPTNLDRNFTCPTAARSLRAVVGGRELTYQPADAPVVAAWDALTPILAPIASPAELKITVILVRRQNGVPHYLYLSNGTQDNVFQGWSSTKFIAFAAAASKLRERSGGKVGLDGNLPAPGGGRAPIGDLITEATTYSGRPHAHLTSNNAATWAKNIAGRQFTQELVTRWLGRANERFDGGYQTYSASHNRRGNGWGLTVRGKGGEEVTAAAPVIPSGAKNALSSRTLAEFLKRMVMHRENPGQAIPNVTWDDLTTIFYGVPQAQSRYFSDMKVGGMQGGASTYLLNALGGDDAKKLEASTWGQWRTITKAGWGRPFKSGEVDLAWHGYGCVPRFDETGKALPTK